MQEKWKDRLSISAITSVLLGGVMVIAAAVVTMVYAAQSNGASQQAATVAEAQAKANHKLGVQNHRLEVATAANSVKGIAALKADAAYLVGILNAICAADRCGPTTPVGSISTTTTTTVPPRQGISSSVPAPRVVGPPAATATPTTTLHRGNGRGNGETKTRTH